MGRGTNWDIVLRIAPPGTQRKRTKTDGDSSRMTAKSEQLQIRVTPEQKDRLRRLARQAGQDASAYVLSRVVPEAGETLRSLLQALRSSAEHRYAPAELNDFLASCTAGQWTAALELAPADLWHLSTFLKNYVAAMVEHACHGRDVPGPSWVRDIPALEEPYFASTLRSLRLHLLAASPVAYKRRSSSSTRPSAAGSDAAWRNSSSRPPTSGA
jgi:hypothetical protein